LGQLCVEVSIIYLRQHSLQLLHNPLRRFAIPLRWDRAFLPLSGHQSRKTRQVGLSGLSGLSGFFGLFGAFG
jgi:hypothetical protein